MSNLLSFLSFSLSNFRHVPPYNNEFSFVGKLVITFQHHHVFVLFFCFWERGVGGASNPRHVRNGPIAADASKAHDSYVGPCQGLLPSMFFFPLGYVPVLIVLI